LKQCLSVYFMWWFKKISWWCGEFWIFMALSLLHCFKNSYKFIYYIVILHTTRSQNTCLLEDSWKLSPCSQLVPSQHQGLNLSGFEFCPIMQQKDGIEAEPWSLKNKNPIPHENRKSAFFPSFPPSQHPLQKKGNYLHMGAIETH